MRDATIGRRGRPISGGSRPARALNVRCVAAVALAIALGTVSACGSDAATGESSGDSSAIVAEAKAFVAGIESSAAQWNGPKEGPKLAPGKTIAYIECTSSTPICVQVGEQVKQIGQTFGWTVKTFSGQGGTQQEVTAAWNQALAIKPDGIINGATDAIANKAALLEAKSLGIPVVGVLSTNKPGAADDVNQFANVSQDPAEIGKAMAMFAIAQTDGKARVALAGVQNYGIAEEKTDEMQAIFKRCSTCEVLAVNYADFSTLQTDTPQLVAGWVSKFGQDFWILSVADAMITPMVVPLRQGGVPEDNVKIVGADGAPDAYSRVADGEYQVATIPAAPEQLAYQAVDELNRAFQGEPATGFAQPLHILTKTTVQENVDALGAAAVYKGSVGFKEQYEAIWSGR